MGIVLGRAPHLNLYHFRSGGAWLAADGGTLPVRGCDDHEGWSLDLAAFNHLRIIRIVALPALRQCARTQ